MKKSLVSNMRKEEGQGMTEYIIIVALIGIAAIGVVTFFGDNIRDLFTTSNNALSGKVDSDRQIGVKNMAAKGRDLTDFGVATESNYSGIQGD
ncbi:Flp family type IVb pilin [bacterium]|nr:Flp family type IVb pilin [bacterium]